MINKMTHDSIMQDTIFVSDIHAGRAYEDSSRYWGRPALDVEKGKRMAMHRIADFIRHSVQETRGGVTVCFHGDVADAWDRALWDKEGRPFDPALARDELLPLAESLRAVREVDVLWGNTEEGAMMDRAQYRALFEAGEGSINFQFPAEGLVWLDADRQLLAIHGDCADPPLHMLQQEAGYQLIPSDIRGIVRMLAKTVLHISDNTAEVEQYLAQALSHDGAETEIRHALWKRNAPRHHEAQTAYMQQQALRHRLPFHVKQWFDSWKGSTVQSAYNGAVLRAVSDLAYRGVVPQIDFVVMGHTHGQCLWTRRQIREMLSAKQASCSPRYFVNTGSAGGELESGLCTFGRRREAASPELYVAYDPKQPASGVYRLA